MKGKEHTIRMLIHKFSSQNTSEKYFSTSKFISYAVLFSITRSDRSSRFCFECRYIFIILKPTKFLKPEWRMKQLRTNYFEKFISS